MLALDDLQWADQASAELIGALLQKPAPAPVLLVIARRPGRSASRLEIGSGAAAVLGGIERMRLEPLTAVEAQELLGERVARSRSLA